MTKKRRKDTPRRPHRLTTLELQALRIIHRLQQGEPPVDHAVMMRRLQAGRRGRR